MKSARIILDTVRPPVAGWTWRDDWYSGIDSSFGLLMKFAMLNALSARELAKIFVSVNCRRRAAICGRPDVDLRSADVFDLEEMSNIFRVGQIQVRSAFLQEILPEGEAQIKRQSALVRIMPSARVSSGYIPSLDGSLLPYSSDCYSIHMPSV